MKVFRKSGLMSRAVQKFTAAFLIPTMGIGLALGTSLGARADDLVVTNGNFSQYSGTTPGTGDDRFTSVNPTNWSGGSGLIFVTNQNGVNNDGLYLPVYNDPTFPAPPPGGNFVEADGNPLFESSFSYQLHGLTVGQTYSITFFQAASQQQGFVGDTTNQWIVGLGTGGFSFTDLHNGFYSYSLNDVNGSVGASPLMTVPTGHYVPWEQVTVTGLVADSADDLLTFLAWGNNGDTANLPPIAFLDIAGNGRALPTPEPSSLALWGTAILAIGIYRARRRAKPATT